ncbi:hypothetical protein M2375_003847 [Comamonas sp. BIGb0152]|nr:hypothetical protein [Comamonas sp. BIGb0152]
MLIGQHVQGSKRGTDEPGNNPRYAHFTGICSPIRSPVSAWLPWDTIGLD